MIKMDNDLAGKELFEALKEALKGIPNNKYPGNDGLLWILWKNSMKHFGIN